MLLWAQGVELPTRGYDVEINEIDVAPVQIQGPKSVMLMEKMFGQRVREIPYYGLIHDTLNGHAVTITRTGFFGRGRLRDIPARRHAARGRRMALHPGAWQGVSTLRVIAPSHIRRLEAGILSYGQGTWT